MASRSCGVESRPWVRWLATSHWSPLLSAPLCTWCWPDLWGCGTPLEVQDQSGSCRPVGSPRPGRPRPQGSVPLTKQACVQGAPPSGQQVASVWGPGRRPGRGDDAAGGAAVCEPVAVGVTDLRGARSAVAGIVGCAVGGSQWDRACPCWYFVWACCHWRFPQCRCQVALPLLFVAAPGLTVCLYKTTKTRLISTLSATTLRCFVAPVQVLIRSFFERTSIKTKQIPRQWVIHSIHCWSQDLFNIMKKKLKLIKTDQA